MSRLMECILLSFLMTVHRIVHTVVSTVDYYISSRIFTSGQGILHNGRL